LLFKCLSLGGSALLEDWGKARSRKQPDEQLYVFFSQREIKLSNSSQA
jgi:hypothetical protein